MLLYFWTAPTENALGAWIHISFGGDDFLVLQMTQLGNTEMQDEVVLEEGLKTKVPLNRRIRYFVPALARLSHTASFAPCLRSPQLR